MERTDITKEGVLNLLKVCLSKTNFKTEAEFDAFKTKILSLLIRIYGEDNSATNGIKSFKFTVFYVHGMNLKDMQIKAKSIVENYIEEIENIGLPPITINEIAPSVNVSTINTNTQNQENNINITLILEELRKELKGTQFDEVNDIIKSQDDQKTKLEKLKEKLESFGKDVLAKVLSSLLAKGIVSAVALI
jgi:hypothetical protein